ncbi:hypothetical protein DNTS_025677 [Danionella cerebrum]|uniref:Uncharacterized protein n=1 Tax=Danionella cerebrum TaxID=2873325 RepID=A0A553QFG8_9TELE|nr:hypothetical protein DNTS_025677 [Danionella translucida]
MLLRCNGLSLESRTLLLDAEVVCPSFSLICPPGSQEDSDCCLHSDSMCLHKGCSEPAASLVCCLFHADDLPFTARDSCKESQHALSKKVALSVMTQHNDVAGEDALVGNVNKLMVTPSGYTGPPKKGHVIFDACFESVDAA